MKKNKILTACSLILLAFILLSSYGKNKNPIKETFNVDATTEKEITDEVTGFYSEYYSGEIEVYDYEVMIVDVEKKVPGLITIKFGVTPQIGAHNPLGYDELSYFVDSMGNKKLSNYEHLNNYEVPERFQKYLIKPLE